MLKERKLGQEGWKQEAWRGREISKAREKKERKEVGNG